MRAPSDPLPSGTPPSDPEVPAGRRLGFTPESRIAGSLRTPGSKSAAQRALLAAALAQGETRILGLPDGDDVTAALGLVLNAGAGAERLFDETPGRGGAGARVLGRPPFGTAPEGLGLAARGPVRLGESGTLARLATAAFGLCGRARTRALLVPEGSLRTRSSRALFDALEAAGVRWLQQNLPGTWPVELLPATPPSTLTLRRPTSSQEVSALLLASAAWPDTIDVEVLGPIPSLPYVGLTRRLLEDFRVTVDELVDAPDPDPRRARRIYRVAGPLVAPDEPLWLEPDASSAAVALAAACLTGGSLTVPGLTPASAQGDVRIVDHLAAFGCEAYADAEGLHAGGAPRRGAELDLRAEPDLAPVLAAVAACAAVQCGDSSLLTGLDTLPGKESDRLAVLAAGLRALGLRADTGDPEAPDRLAIGPGPGRQERVLELDPHGDHRMAFAFALFGLFAEGLWVRDPGCVGKSWRSFWDDLARVGAVVRERR